MALTEAGAKALALIAREAADASDVSANDLRGWLSDALRDARGDDGGYGWCYLTDFIGDGESGVVIFCCDGDLTQAPYTITQTDGNISVDIDVMQCVDVVQTTAYKREGMEGMAMEAAKSPVKNAKMAAKFKPFVKKTAKKAKVAPVSEAGARHSKTDQSLIQAIHDHSIALGADVGAADDSNDNGVDESARTFQVNLVETVPLYHQSAQADEIVEGHFQLGPVAILAAGDRVGNGVSQ